jgi:hypothetical protein
VHDDEQYDKEESARRRDEVIRRMAYTPPQPKITSRPKKIKKAAGDRGIRKVRAPREA